MTVYRLCTQRYSSDLTGNGAKLFGGRWNEPGFSALYTTENISLAVLEILVHAGNNHIPSQYMILKIEIPENSSVTAISKAKLKKNWKDDVEISRFIGNEFIKNKHSLVLKVPSAIVDEENNFILNPAHPEMKKVKIKWVKPFRFDKRLLINE